MSKQNSTKISVKSDGVELSVDGPASQRLAHALMDFISPVTEGFGLLGTWARGARVEAALRATARAKQICLEHDIEISPISPKLILPLIEGASLEDPNDENSLTEMWAHLLANAAVKEEKIQLHFSKILESIGHEEVCFLNAISNQITTDRLQSVRGKLGYYAAQLSDEEIRENWNTDIGQSFSVYSRSDYSSKGTIQSVLGANWIDENYSSILLLKQLGLVDLKSHLDDVEYMSIYLTPIGDEFVTNCTTVSKK